MIVTTAWMEEWFRRFDAEYFGGNLPLPEFSLTRARTRLGQLSFKQASRWGRTHLYDFKISMTTYYDMTDLQAKSVLLHEMIHYVIGYTHLKDTSSHGIVFRGMMDRLNRQYGWQIRISTSTKGWKVNERILQRKEARGPQTYLVLAIRRRDGQCFLCRVSPSAASTLERRVSALPEVETHQWYTTQDSYFADYPQVRSLRGHRISRADYDRLANAMEKVEELGAGGK